VVAKGEGGAVSDLLDLPDDLDSSCGSRDPVGWASPAIRNLGEGWSPGDIVAVGSRGEGNGATS